MANRIVGVLASLALASCERPALRHRRGPSAGGGLVANVPSATRLEMRNYHGVQYHADVTLGGQTLPAIYDTGSFEILALSKRCATCSDNGAPMYDDSLSSSFRADGVEALHAFGSGPVRCRQDFETVAIGGTDSPAHAADVPIWQVLDHNLTVWDDSSFSAIVGLCVTERVPENMASAGASDETLLTLLGVDRFAICLESGQGASGWLTLAPEYDVSRPWFRAVPVVGEASWAVELTDVRLGRVKFADFGNANPCKPSCGALVDSGSSLIGVPPGALSMLNPVLNEIKHDCSNLHELPDLEFTLGGKVFALSPEFYVLEKVRETYSGTTRECVPAFIGISRHSLLGPTFVLGVPFLRRFYTVFDRSGPSLHITEAGEGCAPAGASGALGNAMGNATGGISAAALRKERHALRPALVDLSKARMPAWSVAKGV